MSLQSRLFERVLRLPPPLTRKVAITRDHRIPTPRGLELLADLYSPRDIANAPTLLVRTPYSRRGLVSRMIAWPFAERGYNVLIATVRGTDGSGGEFDPFLNDREDGMATLDWIEKQPWYNGKLVTFGPSYLGYVQLAMAPDAGNRITATMPVIGTSGFRDIFYAGDSFLLSSLLGWTARMVTLERKHPLVVDVLEFLGDKRAQKAMTHLPLSDTDTLGTGKKAHWFQYWLVSNAPNDPYWGPAREHRSRIGEITAPTLLFGGWQDILLPGKLDDYAAMRAAGRNPYLTIGPWLHVDTEVMAEGTREALVWFHAHVSGDHRALRKLPVRLYIQGAEEWREYSQWPPTGIVAETFYFQAHGGLASEPANGSDRFHYDPADPTPTVGGPLLDPRTGGRKDNTAVEARSDLLTYTSRTLDDALEAIGPIAARIQVRLSTGYGDVFVRLCDVDPQGRSLNVCDGIQRVTPERFPPDHDGVQTIPVWITPTAYRFRPGHKLRVQVSGGSFPRFPRNTGTGEPFATATRLVATDFEVLHSSEVTLSVLPASASTPVGAGS